MDGDPDMASRALLQELLAAQSTILQEVRESKDRITALSARLERLEESAVTSGVRRIKTSRGISSVGASTKNAVKEELGIRDLGHARSSARVPPSDIGNNVLTDTVVSADASDTRSANRIDSTSEILMKVS